MPAVIRAVPAGRPVEVIGAVGRLTGRKPAILFKTGRRADVPRNVPDVGLAGRELGWQPETGREDGLHRTIAWRERLPAS